MLSFFKCTECVSMCGGEKFVALPFALRWSVRGLMHVAKPKVSGFPLRSSCSGELSERRQLIEITVTTNVTLHKLLVCPRRTSSVSGFWQIGKFPFRKTISFVSFCYFGNSIKISFQSNPNGLRDGKHSEDYLSSSIPIDHVPVG